MSVPTFSIDKPLFGFPPCQMGENGIRDNFFECRSLDLLGSDEYYTLKEGLPVIPLRDLRTLFGSIETRWTLFGHTFEKRFLFAWEKQKKLLDYEAVKWGHSAFSDIDFQERPLDFHRFIEEKKGKYKNIIGNWIYVYEYYLRVKYVDKKAYINTLTTISDPYKFVEYLRLASSAGYRADRRRLSDFQDSSRLPEIVFTLWKEILARYTLNTSFEVIRNAGIKDRELLESVLPVYEEIYHNLNSSIRQSDSVSIVNKSGKVLDFIDVSIHPEDQGRLLSVIEMMQVLVDENIDKLAMSIAETRDPDKDIPLPPLLTPVFQLREPKVYTSKRPSKKNNLTPLLIIGATAGALLYQG